MFLKMGSDSTTTSLYLPHSRNPPKYLEALLHMGYDNVSSFGFESTSPTKKMM
jgi:hypothetical protein